jgi:hypothetical protein
MDHPQKKSQDVELHFPTVGIVDPIAPRAMNLVPKGRKQAPAP